jgi:hypothetical protein
MFKTAQKAAGESSIMQSRRGRIDDTNVMKTSEDVLEVGLYASLCCGRERVFEKLEVFQRCPGCHDLCVWELAESD